MKKLTAIVMFALVAMTALAVPAKRGVWRTIRMADGTEVRAQRMGDEHLRFWMTEDGRRLSVKSDGTVQVADEAALRQRAAQRRSLRAKASMARRAPLRVSIGDRTSYHGKKKGIVILAQYTDVKFKAANTLEKYKRILNEEGYTSSEGFKGSVADYFKAQSGGQFELDFDVVGPYTLKYERKHYGGNDDTYDQDQAPDEMIVEACRQADAEVNFKDYDWDGDGYVDQVFVLYAGTGEADSNDDEAIWPHMYELSSTNKRLRLDGVYIDTYACSNEVDSYGRIEGIGCFCHEFSHCMGFPDFYDTSYSGNFGMSQFDLMDMGSYNGNAFTPAGYSAHEKMMCGWQEPVELRDSVVNVESLKPMSEGGVGYIIYNQAHPDEYYMLENRQKTGWDAGLPAKGLMITHVDFDKQIWYYNMPNTMLDKNSDEVKYYGYPTNDHQRLTIVHADNDDDSKYWNSRYGYYTKTTLTTDLYPYLRNDSLTNTSAPAATLYNKNTDGGELLNVAVTGIRQNSDGTVSFRYGLSSEEKEETYEPEGDFLFYESFDKCAGKGGNDAVWSGNVATATFQPDYTTWKAAKSYGGDKCAKFGTSSIGGEATTPYIAIDGNGHLSFRAAAWNTPKEAAELTISVEGGTIQPATFTLPKGQWGDFDATVKAEGKVKLTFSSNGRFFLDEVKVITTTDPDGIESIRSTTSDSETYYDLSGRRVVNPTRGIYIVNGRKMVIR